MQFLIMETTEILQSYISFLEPTSTEQGQFFYSVMLVETIYALLDLN